ncbi:MAG: DUF615 domain-containing protein [Gammaproteobacteria bacterium]|nr:DUF615 domain-containing protein [Gammaproteobacteria bacterium]
MTDKTSERLPGPVSKTRRKQESKALQKLGEALVELPADKLANPALPEGLRKAVLEAQGMKKHEARRRQLQYIGRLMREIDPAPVFRLVEDFRQIGANATARHHHVEHWRDRLLAEGDPALSALVGEHPGIDRQALRQLLRTARQQQAAGKTPRAARVLFRYLRELLA